MPKKRKDCMSHFDEIWGTVKHKTIMPKERKYIRVILMKSGARKSMKLLSMPKKRKDCMSHFDEIWGNVKHKIIMSKE